MKRSRQLGLFERQLSLPTRPAPRPPRRSELDGPAWRARDTIAFPGGLDPTWPVVVSYGLGVDSTAVLVLLERSGIVPDKILFSDTGGERPETLAYLAVIQKWLRRVGFPPVTVVRYESKTTAYRTLEENCNEMAMLPSLAYGGHKHGCSLKFKVGPLDHHVKRWGPARDAWARGGRVVRIIGYDDSSADNARRERFETRGGEVDDGRFHYWYPLQTARWDRARCIAEIAAAGLPVPPKSACFYCPSTKPHEVIELVIDHPELAWRIIEMERLASPNLTMIDGLWGAGAVGGRGATPRPGSMSEFILGWMVDGRAYQSLPGPESRVVVAREVQAMRHVGRVVRLPVLAPEREREVSHLAEAGTRAALALLDRFEREHGAGSAQVFFAAGKARGHRRATSARERLLRDRIERGTAAMATATPRERARTERQMLRDRDELASGAVRPRRNPSRRRVSGSAPARASSRAAQAGRWPR